jgi:hypothetical protein
VRTIVSTIDASAAKMVHLAEMTAGSILSRRGFGRLVVTAVAFGVALVRSGTARARALPAERSLARTVYVFDPTAEVSAAGSGCATCAACRRHAANKVFASREAADVRRAHPHCRCAIKAVPVSSIDFVGMFGEPDGPAFRGEFDVRWTGVMGGLEMPA